MKQDNNPNKKITSQSTTIIGITSPNEVDKTETIFSNKKQTRTSAILEASEDFAFHIWTKPATFYHAHANYWEIFIVTEGKLLHHFNNEKTVLKTGDAFLIRPGQYHKHSPYKNYTSQHINLTFSFDYAKELFKMYFNTETPSFPMQLIHLDSLHFNMVGDFQKALFKSVSEDYWNITLKSLIAMIIGLFYVPEDILQMPDWLQTFIQKLHKLNFDNTFKISDTYASSNYSQTTLSREFKKYTGQTLVAYINDLKLNYACNQLQNTNFSVLTIAMTSGFDTYRHFTRLFKAKYGVTPLQYRQQLTSQKNI